MDAGDRAARAALALVAAACVWVAGSGCRSVYAQVAADRALSPQEHLTLGVAYEREGELDAALRHYEAATRDRLPQAYFGIGNVRTQQQQYGKAERAYREALKRQPDYADAMNNLAWVLCLQRTRLEEAETLATQAIALNPAGRAAYDDTLAAIHQAQRQAASPPL